MAVTPILIVGAPHSGTTIVYRMLAMHPATMWFSHLSQRGGRIPGRSRIPFHHHADRTLRAIFPHGWEKVGRGRGPLEGLTRLVVPRPAEAHQIWEYLVSDGSRVPQLESEERIRTVFEEEWRRWKREFMLAKPLWLVERLGVVAEVYPTTRIVNLVRDGRAVAYSLRTKFQRADGSPQQALEAAANHWVRSLRGIDEKRQTMEILDVRYEDLCSDVHGQMRTILEFTGLDSARFPFRRCPRKLETTNARRLADASQREADMLGRIQEPYLRRYGYV